MVLFAKDAYAILVLWRHQSGKSSALWSIAVAATVLGIVIIGHRWQRERYQNQQLLFELSATDETHQIDELDCWMLHFGCMRQSTASTTKYHTMKTFSKEFSAL